VVTGLHRIDVAAGIMVDERGCILLTERLGDSPFAGLWEFPGGKIHGDETAAAAVVRELREELGVVVIASEPFMQVQHDYADRRVALEFFLISEWQGEPSGLDGQALRWCHPEAVKPSEILPADVTVLEALRCRDPANRSATSG